jgi:hypothetical protein
MLLVESALAVSDDGGGPEAITVNVLTGCSLTNWDAATPGKAIRSSAVAVDRIGDSGR